MGHFRNVFNGNASVGHSPEKQELGSEARPGVHRRDVESRLMQGWGAAWVRQEVATAAHQGSL